MIVLLIVLMSLVFYLGIGFSAAIWNLPRYEVAHKDFWGHGPSREDKRVMMTVMIFFWPFYFPVVGFKAVLDRALDRYDPKEIRKRQEEKEKELKALAESVKIKEIEVGIRSSEWPHYYVSEMNNDPSHMLR